MQRVVLLFIIITASCTNPVHEQKAAYRIELAPLNKNISQWPELTTSVKLTCLADTGMIIPKRKWAGRLNLADFGYEIEYKTDSGFRPVATPYKFDLIGWDDSLERLRMTDTVLRAVDLGNYCSFKQKGGYRARALYHGSRFNNLPDIASGWIFFEVTRHHLYTTRPGGMRAIYPNDILLKLPVSEINFKQRYYPVQVMNQTDSTLFYHVAISIQTDTGWTSLASDVHSISRNEILVLSTLKGKAQQNLDVRTGDINPYYLKTGVNKMKLSIAFSSKRSFENNIFETGDYYFNLVK